MTAAVREGIVVGNAPAMGREVWPLGLRIGLAAGVVALYLCLVGIVPTFDARPLIKGVVTLGQAALLVTFLGAGLATAIRLGDKATLPVIGASGLAGLVAGAMLSMLVLLGAAE